MIAREVPGGTRAAAREGRESGTRSRRKALESDLGVAGAIGVTDMSNDG
jgi:hypothetical protein